MITTTKSPTRNDVAKLAGVSPAVVSYVINDSNYVSEEKRTAVLNAIEELQYTPNAYAHGLRTGKSRQIGFVCDNIQNELFSEVEDILFQREYYVSLSYARPDDKFIAMLLSRQFEGIFMTSNLFSSAQLNRIVENGVPVIFYKTRHYDRLDPRIVAVAPSYFEAVRKSVNYLAFKGHQKIALIPPVKYRTQGINGNDFRARAYAQAMQENNLELQPGLVCTTTQTPDAICDSILTMLSKKETQATAFVVGNDYLAAQIMQFLKKLDLRIPQDASIIGADDTDIAPVMSPPLTTVGFSRGEYAHKVVDKLFQLIAGEQPEEEYVKVNLVIRESA
jgi:DNA-binding LacI/PurR family transcriptional regulator